MHPVLTLLGAGMLRLTAGRHRHSTATAMGEDLQWQSSKLTIPYLVDTPTYRGAVSRSWPFIFSFGDFKGQRINVGRFESSLVSKTEIKNSPKVCFLKLLVTLRAQSHVLDRNISNSCFSRFSKNRSTFVSSHYILIVFISKLSLTPSWM